MKNIHVLPTDKPSRLTLLNDERLLFSKEDCETSKTKRCVNQNIYITSDEEIKEEGYVFWEGKIYKYRDFMKMRTPVYTDYFSIILTTDQDLIKDGVQNIPDDFLEWFVKNPSCEKVEVTKVADLDLYYKNGIGGQKYKIIIPKEKPKQLFTDYPITELGDEEFKEVPIRQCELLSYDDNKYCYVKVEGIGKEIKRCYIYSQKGRCGEVDCISVDEIKELLKEQPKQDALNHFLSTSNVFVKDSHKWDFSKEEPKKEYQTCKCGSNWFNTTVADKPFCFKCGESVKEDFKPTEETCTCTDECLGYLTKTCKGIEEEPKQECMITKIMQMDAKMAYDSLPKQDKIMERFIANAKQELRGIPAGTINMVIGKPKQETLEEVAEQFIKKLDFNSLEIDDKIFEAIMFGAKWQQKRSYSEEEVFKLLMEFSSRDINSSSGTPHSIAKWFEQFKKK